MNATFPSHRSRLISAAGLVLAGLVAGCSGVQATLHSPASTPSHPVATHAASTPAPAGPATQVASYPVRVGAYRLVNKNERTVAATTKDVKFTQGFSFAATARDGFYLPGHQARQDVYLIAGQLARGVSPAAALGDYLGEFQGQEVHLTAERAGPLGGEVKCWESGGFTFCMWVDDGTYGVLDYRPPFGLDTALIRHLAGLVPRFRQALERVKQ